MEYDVIVVGAGPAGMLAAATAARYGRKVLLLEHQERPGRKLGITGKGRCNLTNRSGTDRIVAAFPRGGRFLYSAVSRFTPEDVMELFESLGVPLKTERGNRVFPQSDRARDVVEALVRYVKDSGAVLQTNAHVHQLLLENGAVAGVACRTRQGEETFSAPKVLLAGGGLSYPGTGSDGSCYALAKQAGHSITPLSASLAPIVTAEDWPGQAQGLSLKNVSLTVTDGVTGKKVFAKQGEMLFTHFGVSGPLVLSASVWIRPMEPGRYTLSIDLKPALTPEQLDARLVREFEEHSNRDFCNALDGLLPKKLIDPIVALSGIPARQKANAVTKAQRQKLGGLLKHLTLTAKEFRPIAEAIVTGGGVSLKEVSPKTMESKLVKGLYFAGELLDVDGYTGGFHLQMAFSTGYAAGEAMGRWDGIEETVSPKGE